MVDSQGLQKQYLMGIKKTIVVLANSKKTGGRCLAGKELILNGKTWNVGSWIRPVTDERSGAVPAYLMQNVLGHIPRPLEIIEIPFSKPVATDDQPENWLIETAAQPNSWAPRGFFPWSDIELLLDQPNILWHERESPRRVKAGYIQKMEKPASLYLIKPDQIENIKVWSERDGFNGTIKNRRRAYIRYAKTSHEFDIDDIDLQEKYYSKIPSLYEAAIFPKLGNPEETIVCVSLTPKFKDDNHYKIAAAFLEPPVK